MRRNPAASELYQSWRTVLGCMIAASVGTIGIYAYTSGVFVPILVAEAGFTRDQLSFATFLISATVAVLAPFAGALMDRHGAVRIITLSLIGEAAAFAALAVVPRSFTIYAVAVVALAALGVGTTPPGYSRIVTARFERSRGAALGIAISGLGFMAIGSPIAANWIIETWSWRAGYVAISIAVLLLGGGGLLLVAADGKPDRDRGNRQTLSQTTSAAAEHSRHTAGDWSALRKPLFWVVLAAFLAPALFGGGYLFHLVTLLRARGFEPGRAAQVQSLVGFAVLIGRVGSGVAMDRFFAPYVAAVAFLISAAGCLLLLTSAAVPLCAAAFAIGLTIGAELDILAYMIARYFGVQTFGRLYGLCYGALIVSAGLSPMLISLMASEGSYTRALIISAIGTGAGAIMLACMPRYPLGRSGRIHDAIPARARVIEATNKPST